MDALEAMRTIGANRQPVRLVVVRDQAKKTRLKELYLPWWKAYFDAAEAGIAGAEAGSSKLGQYGSAHKALLAANDFAEKLDRHPLIVVVCARREDLHITDLELDRPSVVGGASIYPLVQNLCIAFRVAGVATTVTTLLCGSEPEVKELLGIPNDYLTACHVVAGYPANGFPKKLRRLPVEETVFIDSFGAQAQISSSSR